MTPENKEIDFWLKIDEKPPFIEECGIDWKELTNKRIEERKKEENELFQEENNKYLEALTGLTNKDIEAFEEDGVLPQSILEVVSLDTDMHFKFKKIPSMVPSTGGYVFDDITYDGIDRNPED